MRKGTLKNVLMISYYFPPSGGSGVQRVLKYVKYLPQMGFRPIVLTVKEGSFDIEDKSLFLDIQDNVKVYRVPIFEPRRIYAFFQKKSSRFDKINKTDTIVNNKNKPLGKVSEWIRSNLFVPDSRMLWIPAAIRLGKQIIEKENISCIFSSSPPFTCSVIGKKLKQATRLPWINDIRDPWTNHAPLVKRSCLPLLLDRYLERKSYEVCDVFHYAWKGIYDDIVKKYPHVNPNKSMWIPNGYDEDDFVTLPDSISKDIRRALLNKK
ncbi:hypothetical protein CHS0354_000556 [Potamilus streckersoni]|uniref:Glycosyltransferase subfamily 4-like N-terminal domain-containing protein n=1 Tax=Potamilus streckersoni TaxID=2493646 RepID=A0AAE0T7J7_9BIVA|nr:hypothetical protein CHS0354_000556 [Potamilus streckersoni]